MSEAFLNRVTMSRAEFDSRSAYLKQENAKWGLQMEDVSEIFWPRVNPSPIRIMRNSDFLAQIFASVNGGQRISICRCAITRDGDWRADISWEELMAVKSQCGFSDHWAVEVFPPDNEVVNVANMRHLWIIPQPTFAWTRQAPHD
jgi:hypothetical protein